MTQADIVELRLASHRLGGGGEVSSAKLLSTIGAVQAQDYGASLWALGLRLRSFGKASLQAAIDRGDIVRSWPLRGTLHFSAPQNLRWMLELLAPRVIASDRGRLKQLGLDEAALEKSASLFAEALRGRKNLSRDEMMTLLEDKGISTEGQRGYHILWNLAQRGILCFGALNGKEQGFVSFDEWVPAGPSLGRDEALEKIARLYFAGRGPASLEDFVWWTGLTLVDARDAIERAETGMQKTNYEGRDLWYVEQAGTNATSHPALLLPAFDEYIIGYKDRSTVLAPKHRDRVISRNGIFFPTIVVAGRVVGLWKRRAGKRGVEIAIEPFRKLGKAERAALDQAAEGYATFLDLPLASISTSPPGDDAT